MGLFSKIAAFSALSALSVSAFAFPIAIIGTEGLPVIATGGPVIATYEGNSAGYSNDLLFNSLFIFNNHGSPVGSTANLGTYANGTELVLHAYKPIGSQTPRWSASKICAVCLKVKTVITT